MSMYSKTNVLKQSRFDFIMHVLLGRQRQSLNGYFSVKMGIIFNF